MKRKPLILMLTLFSLFVFSACTKQASPPPATPETPGLEDGVKAFQTLLEKYPKQVGYHEELSHWGFAPEEGYKFEWSSNASANKADFALVLPAEALVSAGLKVDQLDPSIFLFEPGGTDSMGMAQADRLIFPYELSEKATESKSSGEAFSSLMALDPELIMYHPEGQHYILNLGDGNEVIWTEDLSLNEKDMLLVLNAAPLVSAGLDLTKLTGGWEFVPAGNEGMVPNPDQIRIAFSLKN